MKAFNHSDILALEKRYRTNLINKISGYKSAHLIGTQNAAGQTNLAIFSSVVHIGANPPYLGFIMRPTSVERHTYENIKSMGYFTLNMVTADLHEQAHLTAARFPRENSEFAATGLTEAYLADFPAPFVEESALKIGLSFAEEQLITVNQTVLIIGKVEQLILPTDAIKADGDLDLEALNTVTIG
ncbi:MAG: flavin reductase family protein, partial [Saprospiraceae bacterium]